MQRLWDIMQTVFRLRSAFQNCMLERVLNCIVNIWTTMINLVFVFQKYSSESISHVVRHCLIISVLQECGSFVLFTKCQSRQQTEKYLWQLIWYAGTLKSHKGNLYPFYDSHEVINHNAYIQLECWFAFCNKGINSGVGFWKW